MRRGARLGRTLAGALAAAGLVPVVVLACSGASSHPYAARRFDATRTCVDRTTTIDVVEGPPAANCSVVCLVGAAPDAGSSLYVSLMCAPYPPAFDASGKDPRCRAAIDALERGDTCFADGGSANPVEGGTDATVDVAARVDVGEKDASRE